MEETGMVECNGRNYRQQKWQAIPQNSTIMVTIL